MNREYSSRWSGASDAYEAYFHEDYLAPPSPSNQIAIEEALRLAGIDSGRDVFFDPACYDGRVPIRAVQEPFNARCAVGIDIDPDICKIAQKKVKELKLQDKVKIINRNLFKCRLRRADVVYLYLSIDSNEKVRTKLEEELKKTARVVSYIYEVKKWKPLKISEVTVPLGDDTRYAVSRHIFLYRMDRI